MSRHRLYLIVLLALFGLSLTACVAYERPYPGGYVYNLPPAGGYYDYRYYPNSQVYFDIHRRVYFYFSDNGWVRVRVLPARLRARLGHYIAIHSRDDRPYREHREHLRQYPPRRSHNPYPRAHHGDWNPGENHPPPQKYKEKSGKNEKDKKDKGHDSKHRRPKQRSNDHDDDR